MTSRWIMFAVALCGLLWLDFSLALAGSLYRNDIKAVYVGLFLIAVIAAVFGRVWTAALVLHCAALAYFAWRNAADRTAGDWFGWLLWVIIVNALVALVMVLRGRLSIFGR